jgi:hypothetical protein
MIMRRILSAVVVTITVLVVNTDGALAKTISDPNESSITQHDVRSTSLTKPGAGHLSWKVVTWDTWASKTIVPPSGGPLTLYLDMKGTKAADYRVEVQWASVAGGGVLSCMLEKADGASIGHGDVSRPSRSSVKCLFPTSNLTKDKTTRWRVETAPSFGLQDDKAPNSGWIRGTG